MADNMILPTCTCHTFHTLFASLPTCTCHSTSLTSYTTHLHQCYKHTICKQIQSHINSTLHSTPMDLSTSSPRLWLGVGHKRKRADIDTATYQAWDTWTKSQMTNELIPADTLHENAAAALPDTAAYLQQLKDAHAATQASYRIPEDAPPHVPSHIGHPILPSSTGSSSSPQPTASAAPYQSIPEGDTILRATVYSTSSAKRKSEFLLCSSQTLADLKDALYCVHDHTLGGEHLHASYFFIEGVVYDDTRPVITTSSTSSNTVRPVLSTPIIQWSRSAIARHRPSGWGPIRAQSMSDVRLEQLHLRLGAHYVYVHAGDCTHIVVFTDMRTKTIADEPNYAMYPICVTQSQLTRARCAACSAYANYVLFGHKLCKSSPAYLCSGCYSKLVLDADGALTWDDFSVFEYMHQA